MSKVFVPYDVPVKMAFEEYQKDEEELEKASRKLEECKMKVIEKKGLLEESWRFYLHEEEMYEKNYALYSAVEKGDLDKVKEMLGYEEINVNVQNKDGDTPLHIACRLRHWHIVECLIERGAQSNIENIHGQWPMNCIGKRYIGGN